MSREITFALQLDKTDAMLGLALVCYYKNDPVNAKKQLDKAKALDPLLKQVIAGFDTCKKGGYICSEKNNEALIIMLTKWE